MTEDISRLKFKEFKTTWKQLIMLCDIKMISIDKYQPIYSNLLKQWNETLESYKSGTDEFELYPDREARSKILVNTLQKYITKLKQEYTHALKVLGDNNSTTGKQPETVYIYQLPPNVAAIYRTV